MTDRPIIFSGPMVRALLAGHKTQTRRLLKPQPVCDHNFSSGEPTRMAIDEDGAHCSVCGAGVQLAHRRKSGVCGIPVRFGVGDRLYVRETWQVRGLALGRPIAESRIAAPSAFHYRATDNGAWKPYWGKWRSPLHMPRWASRLTLKVADVRVQQLQDLTEEDALAEGAGAWSIEGERFDKRPSAEDCAIFARVKYGSAVRAFSNIWDTINGTDAWTHNPWVIATSFRVHPANIDQLPTLQEVA
jgi:hypothetical protein